MPNTYISWIERNSFGLKESQFGESKRENVPYLLKAFTLPGMEDEIPSTSSKSYYISSLPLPHLSGRKCVRLQRKSIQDIMRRGYYYRELKEHWKAFPFIGGLFVQL